jgi:SAM-dependent methyltransferase
VLTPARRRGEELIDDPAIDGRTVVRSLEDVARSNALFGGRRAVLAALAPVIAEARGGGRTGALTLLDVGTGLGDIPWHARRRAERAGVQLTTFGVELSAPLAAASRTRVAASVCADAFRLPFADASVDVVTASQLAHHFADADARRLLAELDRVARRLVVVGDLRRSYAAAAGFWLAARALRFHPVTQHDGVVSVFRGFTAPELAAHVRAAAPGARDVHVRHRLGWRVVATWRPSPLRAPAPAPRAPNGAPAVAPARPSALLA